MDERRAGELVELAETAEPHLYGPGQREWRARLNAHAEEIEEALRFLLNAGAADAALRMAGALRLYWMDTGRVDQGRDWLGSALDADQGSPSLARARALVAAGELAFRQGHQEAARSHTVEALRLAELLGDRSTAALAHTRRATKVARRCESGWASLPAL